MFVLQLLAAMSGPIMGGLLLASVHVMGCPDAATYVNIGWDDVFAMFCVRVA